MILKLAGYGAPANRAGLAAAIPIPEQAEFPRLAANGARGESPRESPTGGDCYMKAGSTGIEISLLVQSQRPFVFDVLVADGLILITQVKNSRHDDPDSDAD